MIARSVAACAMLLLGACASSLPQPSTLQDPFWSHLRALCGKAFRGQVVEGTAAGDDAFRNVELVMHVRDCAMDEIRIPFHAGANRSRTWVLTRTARGLRLKHDHRHEDGTPDTVTQYGGDTRDRGSTSRQTFPADAYTAELIPAAATNVWTVEIHPGATFAYALHRADRRFRLEFDLTQPVATPPPPWGAN